MSERRQSEKLIVTLKECGLRAATSKNQAEFSGFPIPLRLESGETITLDLGEPGMLSNMDPDVVGVAALDALGYTRRAWGLARRLRWFQPQESALLTEIGPMVQAAYEGVHGSLYAEGYRFYAAAADSTGSIVVVLVTYAGEERKALRKVDLYSREAEALKKIGRALNMNQSLVPLCYAAVHEIASVGELAAVLLWTIATPEPVLELAASTGANRAGTQALAKLSVSGGSSCVAELVAGNRQPFYLPNVKSHVMTADLEGRLCYLEPGPVSVWPLVTGGNLIGVLELIGREGDAHFEEHLELFQTIAEHLALAINSSMLFENYERLATHDPLTGLANHRTMHEFLNLRLAESQRTNAEVGLIMIDVDHFRSFNEEEGHETGDQVLRLVAETIRSVVRPYDLAARYGGEEFTVVLPGSGRESTHTIAERIRSKMEAVPFITRSGRQRHVTVSVGFSVFPHTASEAASLLRAADGALYEAKRTGRNRVVFAESSILEQVDGEGTTLDALWPWVPAASRESVRKRLLRLEPLLSSLGASLHLSRNQIQILRGLLIVEECYRSCCERGDKRKLRALEKLGEFRLLEPSLATLEERYDGRGPQGIGGTRLPLLGRLLAVLVAFDSDRGASFVTDPGRYDPEMVALIDQLADAA